MALVTPLYEITPVLAGTKVRVGGTGSISR